jgi:hypothetical protein
MNRYARELRRATEPTRVALEMAKAIRQHLRDLRDDDPGDNDALARIDIALATYTIDQVIASLDALASRR